MGLETQRLASDATAAKLSYYGGPVLENVKVQIVYWSGAKNVFGSGQLERFYTDVSKSAYFDWLSEYDTTSPRQTIGHGSFIGSVDDVAGKIGAVSDAGIQAELKKLVAAKKLDTSDVRNTLYMVHFPPGMSITQGGSTSCREFCAYHGSFSLGGHNVYYGVIPDQGADGCEAGCGHGSHLENTTSTTSHELVEAVTDPGVGLATGYSAPLAWYDPKNGEIGDICATGASHTGTVGGWTVQKEWSNQHKGCIVTEDASPPPAADDFSIALDTGAVTVAVGDATNVTVTTAAVSGNPGPITLTATGLPGGVAAAFHPATVAPGERSMLTISADESIGDTTSTLVVTGTAGDTSRSASAGLTVRVSPVLPGGDLVENGSFESAAAGWMESGNVLITTQAHDDGDHSARLGSSGSANGESVLSQTLDLPAGTTLTLAFQYLRRCRDAQGGGKQAVHVADPSGKVKATVFETCETDGDWTEASFDLSPYAGQKIVLSFSTFSPGVETAATWMYVDGVTVTARP